jgi:hypothetical protein
MNHDIMRFFFRGIFFLLAIVLISSCKKNDELNQVKISGKVLDKTSGLPIHEAFVSISTTDGWFNSKTFNEVLTDSTGSYKISFSKSDVTDPSIKFADDDHKSKTQVINLSIPDQVINVDLDSL